MKGLAFQHLGTTPAPKAAKPAVPRFPKKVAKAKMPAGKKGGGLGKKFGPKAKTSMKVAPNPFMARK